MNIDIKVVPKVENFFRTNENASIYVICGSRGKGATWGIGYELILKSLIAPHFALCSREIKDTVDVSSKRTIERLITDAGLKDYFKFYAKETVRKETKTLPESRFIYTGLSKLTEDNVQGVEGVTLVWLGEAHTMELSTWQKLEPTIREDGSKIYIDYNTRTANTPIHLLMTEDPLAWPFRGNPKMRGLAYLFLTSYDNPYLPKKLSDMREANKVQYSKEDWEWIWLGKLQNEEDHYVCNARDFKEAMGRDLPYGPDDKPVVGADIAHMGGDEIVFYMRIGMKIVKRFARSRMSAPEVYRSLREFVEDDLEVLINMDNGHVGAAVADWMEQDGFMVNRINFGSPSSDAKYYDPEHCYEVATDMAFNFVENCLPVASLPPDDNICMQQCVQRKWKFRLDGKAVRQIESKKDFRDHAIHLEGHKSPDRCDALWLCFYLDNYGHKERLHDMIGY